MKISRETLHQLIENKLCQAGLKREHAATVASIGLRRCQRDPLSWRGARGILRGTHLKGGTNREPEFRLRGNQAMLGNFTCRQCCRTGRGENRYGTCH